MRVVFPVALAAVLVPFTLVACGDDDGAGSIPPPPPTPPPMDAGSEPDSGPARSDMGPAERDAARRDSGGTRTNVAGRHDVELVVEDETRSFIVYVPEQAAGDVAAPVVFMVHGTAQSGETFFGPRTGGPDGSAWRATADAEGFIVVFPNALTYCFFEDENADGDFDDPGERQAVSKWSAGFFDSHPTCSPAEIAALPAGVRSRADHPIRDDIAFFAAMIDFLESDYVIDSRRVYATGFSSGGQMTSLLAMEMSDRFAAIAASAGFLDVEPRAAARPIPIVASVGASDEKFTTLPATIPLDESLLMSPRFANIVREYLAVAQLESTYTHESLMVGTTAVSRFSYSTSAIGADNRFEILVIEGLVHIYPAFESRLWDFFSRYSLP